MIKHEFILWRFLQNNSMALDMHKICQWTPANNIIFIT